VVSSQWSVGGMQPTIHHSSFTCNNWQLPTD
jgi:hypothetical protein